MEKKVLPNYDSMSTENLEAIIDRFFDLEERQIDVSYDELAYIGGLLVERKKADGSWVADDTETCLAEFKKYYAPEFYGLQPQSKISVWLFKFRKRVKYKCRELKVCLGRKRKS